MEKTESKTSRRPRGDVPPGAVSVRPDDAFALLGVGRTKGWELLKMGALESVLVGKTRLVTMRSIRALVHSDEVDEAA